MNTLMAVGVERERQIEDHDWTPEHDDQQTVANWAWLIGRRSSDLTCPHPEVVDDPRRLLLEIAAIAVAAIESIDRTTEARKASE